MNRAERRAQAKQQKRSPSKPPFTYNPLTQLAMCRVYEPDEIVVYQARLHTALNRFRDGEGTREDFDEITMAFNVGLVRAESISARLCQMMYEGQLAFMKVRDRVKNGKSMLFGAGEFVAAANALEAYDAILEKSTPKQMQDALKVVLYRLEKRMYVKVGEDYVVDAQRPRDTANTDLSRGNGTADRPSAHSNEA